MVLVSVLMHCLLCVVTTGVAAFEKLSARLGEDPESGREAIRPG